MRIIDFQNTPNYLTPSQMTKTVLIALGIYVFHLIVPVVCFSSVGTRKNNRRWYIGHAQLYAEKETSSYQDSDATSKGFVSSLTGLVNLFSSSPSDDETSSSASRSSPPPATPEQLAQRIKDDYEQRNYLWTGNIDLACFEKDCTFTDPTLSFTGTEQYVKNVKNLVPIVDALTEEDGCQSVLLQTDVNSDKGYVQTRWNMVGTLSGLPWKPKIDVIGRTKFWYQKSTNGETTKGSSNVAENKNNSNGLRVYFYDEEWEIPAGLALLQLITPAGTIPNTSNKE